MVLKKIITFVCFICFLIHSLFSFCSNYLNENNAVNVNPVSLSSIPFPLLLEITLRPGDSAMQRMIVNRETNVFSGFNGTILKEYGYDSTWDYFTGKRSNVQTRKSTNLTGEYKINHEFWSLQRSDHFNLFRNILQFQHSHEATGHCGRYLGLHF